MDRGVRVGTTIRATQTVECVAAPAADLMVKT
jgi:hypothetical protein